MLWERSRFRLGVSADRVARAAAPLLIVRVIEGLAAWLFFNEFFLAVAPFPLVVQGSFVVYLLLNLLIALRYRGGRSSIGLVTFDGLANVLSLAVPVAASGGLASPLLLLFPFKSLHYGMVFGVPAAAGFLVATGAMVAGLWYVQWAALLPVIPLALLGPKAAHSAVKFTILGILVGAPVATAWLRRVVGPIHHPAGARPVEGRGRDNHSAVAGALLTVSEAVSRLTRLDEILEKVVEIAPSSLAVDCCNIVLWDEDTSTYTGAVAAGAAAATDRWFSGLQLSRESVPDYEWVRRLGQCAVVSAAESEHVSDLDLPAVLIAPLLSGDRFYGVMEFARRRAHRAFTQRDLTIADGIARQTAVALERARLIGDSRRLVRAVESMEQGVVITDARGRIIFANTALMRTLGYQREEVLGRDAVDLAGESKEWLAELSGVLQHRSWRGETVAGRKDGSQIPIMLNASVIRDEDGRVQGAVGILEDISEEKSFQAHMQRADRLAAVGEMAAGMAHEINNALAVICGQTEDTATASQSELRAALAKVDGQARRIAAFVQGVLGFARPSAPHPETVDLAAVTAKTLDLVRHDLVRQNVELETTFDPDLPPACADPQQLQQVLLNLFGNALQAMAGQERSWMRVEVLGIDNHLGVRVSDSGPGIPPEVASRIFDPFFSTKAEGSGLGLSVSYAIARAHGGDLQVASEVGKCTTFTLLLPIAEPAPAQIPGRALLVDDDPDVAEALSAMLAKEGLQVTRAATGTEAMQKMESEPWDAIVLDVRLPDLSGPEIYAELARTHPQLAERVVFVTGGVWRSESRLREELPAQPILAKPCTQDQVRGVLRRLRSGRRQAA